MGEVYFYIERWTDEVMPCAPSLEGWAEWLAAPDPDWNCQGAVNGEEFEAATLILLGDIVARGDGAKWAHDPPPEGADEFYCRDGEGRGWDAESFGSSVAEAAAWADEPTVWRDLPGGGKAGNELKPPEGGEAHIACLKWGPKHRLRFERGPDGPRMVDLGPAQ
jgi:hypothetical protein